MSVDRHKCLEGFAAIMALVGVAQLSPARADCDPQELAKLIIVHPNSGDFFGYAVALDADTAVIGAYGDDHGDLMFAGSAFVFVRSDGVWTQQARLTASDAADGDHFGYSVALDGDTVVVGAYADDLGVCVDAGSAYVFVRSGDAWTQQAKLTASEVGADDHFGNSVSLDGDTAVIGVYKDDHAGGTDAGSAYVFVRSEGVWTEQAELTGSDVVAYDWFGSSVALDGSTAVIGAEYAGEVSAGSAYVFVRSGSLWTEQAKLTASDGAGNDQFGHSASLDGDTALIGAFNDDHAGGTNAGSAYVFVCSDGVWTEQAKLVASDAAEYDTFGCSVALDGDAAVVGAAFASVNSAGSAYAFVRSGDVWTEHATLTASDAAAQDCLGKSVAVDGDTALIGAPYDDYETEGNAGSAYVFDLNCIAGDVDADGDVDMADLAALLAAYGTCDDDPDYDPAADFDNSGCVDLSDLAVLLANYAYGT